MNKIFAVTLALAMTACVATHQWAPGPESTKSFGVASGQCKMAALGAPNPDGGFEASGSPRFVAAAAGGYAIGSAIGSVNRTRAIYNACNGGRGFRCGGSAAGDKPGTCGDRNPSTCCNPDIRGNHGTHDNPDIIGACTFTCTGDRPHIPTCQFVAEYHSANLSKHGTSTGICGTRGAYTKPNTPTCPRSSTTGGRCVFTSARGNGCTRDSRRSIRHFL